MGAWWVHPALSQVHGTAVSEGGTPALSAPVLLGHLHPCSRPAGSQHLASSSSSCGLQRVTVLGFRLTTCNPSLWVANVTQRIMNARFLHYTLLDLGAFDTFLPSNPVIKLR